jgi:calcium-dependent protein kinase
MRKALTFLLLEFPLSNDRGGNLTNRVFNEGQSAIIVRKVLSALKYMHSNGVAHRDIKLENILLDGNNEPKIIDFGLAAKFQSDEYANLAGTVGTLYSMAPEVLDGSSYDFKCDIWSVGVVTYLLLSQMQPFWGPYEPMSWHRRRQVMIDLILECRYSPMEGQTWDGVSESAKRFIESLLRFDASDRPTASMAYKSPWISWSEELPALSLMNDGVQDLSYKKSQEQLTEFRRKACILLTTECNLTQISELQQRLEQRDTTGRGFVTAKDLADEILALGKSDAKMLSDDQLPKDGGASIEYIDFIAQVQRGHRRNTMNKLGSVVDELGAKSTKQVKIAALLHRLNPNDFPDDFWQDLRTMLGALRDFHGEQGSLSSYDVLNWMEKRMSHDNGNRFANDVVG